MNGSSVYLDVNSSKKFVPGVAGKGTATVQTNPFENVPSSRKARLKDVA